LLPFVQATTLVIVFGWFVGIEKGWRILHEGAQVVIPKVFKWVIKYLTPSFLLLIFTTFTLRNAFGWNFSLAAPAFDPTGYVKDLVGDAPSAVARLMVLVILAVIVFAAVLVNLGGRSWARRRAEPST
jgi:hypothetical protein